MANIDEVLAKLREELGASIAEQPSGKMVHGIPTGSLALDVALGTGGWPQGHFTELYGKKGGGKSTLCMQSCIRAVADGKRAVYFDLEFKLPPTYWYSCGLPEDRLILLHPATEDGERVDTEDKVFKVLDALHKHADGPFVILSKLYSGTLTLDVLRYILKNKMMSLAILDSVAGITSTIEFDKKAQDVTVALTARIMSATLRSLAAPLGLSNCAVVLTNQIREQIGNYPMPRTTPGGWAVKFWSAIRAEINVISRGKDKQTSRIRIKESCLSVPRKEAEVTFVYGKGIDYVQDVFNVAVQTDTVSTAGGWCKFDGKPLGNDRTKEAAVGFLRDNPEIVEQIREAVLKQ